MFGLARRPLNYILKNASALNTSSTRYAEAELLETALVIMTKEEIQKKNAMSRKIRVCCRVGILPVSGVPEEHRCRNRRVRIYKPAKNAMQSGIDNTLCWMMEFDTRKRWEHPLIGYQSSADPLAGVFVAFRTKREAIEHCDKNGWMWFIDEKNVNRSTKPRNYASIYAWNRRTRASTK